MTEQTRRDVFPLVALAVLLGATALWWAFALWPVDQGAAPWLERARLVCFNTTESGLPDRSGWILLIGQPLGMLALLAVGWGRRSVDALADLGSSRGGRLLVGAVALGLVVGAGAASVRVASALDATGGPRGEAALAAVATWSGAEVPETYPRLDRPWPEVGGLVDQHGAAFSLERLDGRPALVTFAFAHCETLCPVLVESAKTARKRLAGELPDLAIVALTLDPWRDTPSRLPAMARDWGLADTDFVLSGAVEDVERALDAWGVARQRDERTGEVVHPALVFVVQGDGTVAYGTAGSPDQIVALARRLE